MTDFNHINVFVYRNGMIEMGGSVAGQSTSTVCDATSASRSAGVFPSGCCAALHVQLVAPLLLPLHRWATSLVDHVLPPDKG